MNIKLFGRFNNVHLTNNFILDGSCITLDTIEYKWLCVGRISNTCCVCEGLDYGWFKVDKLACTSLLICALAIPFALEGINIGWWANPNEKHEV